MSHSDVVSAFRRDGHVRIPTLFRPSEIAALDRALGEAQAGLEPLQSNVDASLKRGAFCSRRSAEIAAFVRNPRLGSLAAELLGVRTVRFIQDILFQKDREHSHTPWHRDSDFWSFSGIGALTLWIPLQNTPLSMSPLRYATASHRESEPRPLHAVQVCGIPLRYRIASSPLALGDAALHHFKTLHGAARNREPGASRRAFAIHLIDGDAIFRAPRFAGQFEHALSCGWDRLNDGDRFTDEIAPLIWK